MRKPLLSLAVAALLASGCGSAYAPTTNQGGAPVPPDHHYPTYPPQPAGPAATPYGGVTYQDPGTNPWVDPSKDEHSTFALDIDTASYSIAQRYVHDGNQPDPASVRVEEWVNAFAQDYPAPEKDAFAIVADGGPTPFTAEDEVLLRIGLQARAVANRDREQVSLTFVIDTSGSMEQGGRLEMVKDAMRILIKGLDRSDHVSIVSFGSDAKVVLGPTPADDDGAILDAIDRLHPGGSTNLEAGLRLGYELARKTMTENGIDRIVLASDGVANVGLTDPGSILETISRDAAAGIELVSVGAGMGNYNDTLLETLADKGDGFYAYIDQIAEAERLFAERLTSTLQTVALDGKAEVRFNPGVVRTYRLLGYEDRAIPDGSLQDPGVGGGETGAGHVTTALYDIELRDTEARSSSLVATAMVHWTDPDIKTGRDRSLDVSLSDVNRTFADAPVRLRQDVWVAAFAERLRGAEWSGYVGLGRVADGVARVAGQLDGDPDVAELGRLVATASGLRD
jgi:Ca-activated chloride channel family protein